MHLHHLAEAEVAKAMFFHLDVFQAVIPAHHVKADHVVAVRRGGLVQAGNAAKRHSKQHFGLLPRSDGALDGEKVVVMPFVIGLQAKHQPFVVAFHIHPHHNINLFKPAHSFLLAFLSFYYTAFPAGGQWGS